MSAVRSHRSGEIYPSDEGKPKVTFVDCCRWFGWVFVILTVFIWWINTNACGNRPIMHYDNVILHSSIIVWQGARSSIPVLILLAAAALNLLAVIGLILAVKKMETSSASAAIKAL